MANKKVRMLVSRGNPAAGFGLIRQGAVVELPEFWADRFIADGTAELVEGKVEKTESEPKKKSKK